MRQLFLSIGFVLISFSGLTGVRADDREDAISELADQLAEHMAGKSLTSFKPNLNEVKGFEPQRFPPSKGGVFEELLAKKLRPYGIKISGQAGLVLEANWQRLKQDNDVSLHLVAKMREFNFYSSTGLTRSPDIAEVLGKSWVSPPFTLKKPPLEDSKFEEELRAKTIYTSDDGNILYSDSDTQFGAEVYVGGTFDLNGLNNTTPRNFFEQMQPWGVYGAGELEGLAFTNIQRGEEFSVRLHNNTDYEVVANLKVDGVNCFYFSDSAYRKLNVAGESIPKNNYWIIPPKTKQLVSGWFKSDSRSQRFKLTPFEESAVARAGLPAKNVGMVTIKFHGSWQGKRRPDDLAILPPDEPQVAYTYQVNVTQTRQVTQNYTVRVPVNDGNGNTTYRNETKTRMVPTTTTRSESRTAVGFGTEVISNPSQKLDRVIGVPRGTISFRYK